MKLISVRYLKKFILVFTTFIILGLFFLLRSDKRKEFNSCLWLAGVEKRYVMAQDLITSKILLGKDTNEVKNLLGQPNSKPTDSNANPYAINRWFYYMGESDFMYRRKSHDLIIRFDNNKASDVSELEVDQ